MWLTSGRLKRKTCEPVVWRRQHLTTQLDHSTAPTNPNVTPSTPARVGALILCVTGHDVTRWVPTGHPQHTGGSQQRRNTRVEQILRREGTWIWRIQPIFLRVFWICTQREAEVDHEAVQAEADIRRRITTTEVTNEKQSKSKNSSQMMTAWSYDVVVEKARQQRSWRTRHAAMCINLPLKTFNGPGELAPMCAQVV